MDLEFFLAGGFGLLVALIGWSDQIRGMQQSTREAENQLQAASELSWGILRHLVRPSEESDSRQALLAVLRAYGKGALKEEKRNKLYLDFQVTNAARKSLTLLLEIRFWGAYVMCGHMLIAAGWLYFLEGPIFKDGWVTWTHVHGSTSAALLTFLVVLTGVINAREGRFRDRLSLLDDTIRTLPATDTENRDGRSQSR